MSSDSENKKSEDQVDKQDTNKQDVSTNHQLKNDSNNQNKDKQESETEVESSNCSECQCQEILGKDFNPQQLKVILLAAGIIVILALIMSCMALVLAADNSSQICTGNFLY